MNAGGRTNQETESRKSCIRDLKKSCGCEGIPKSLFGDTISGAVFFWVLFFSLDKEKYLAVESETNAKIQFLFQICHQRHNENVNQVIE